MRVLIVTSYFPPEIGAASVRISNLANGFKKYGAKVDILAPLPNYPLGKIFPEYKGRLFKKETIDNHTVYRYWTYATISKNPFLRAIGMFSFAIMIWLFGLRRKLINEYDCIIVQSPPLLVSYSAIKLFKCIYKKQVILNVSDLWPLSAVELGVMKEGSLSYKLFSDRKSVV